MGKLRRERQFFAEYVRVRDGEEQRRLRRFFSKAERDSFASRYGKNVDPRSRELRAFIAAIKEDINGPDDIRIS